MISRAVYYATAEQFSRMNRRLPNNLVRSSANRHHAVSACERTAYCFRTTPICRGRVTSGRSHVPIRKVSFESKALRGLVGNLLAVSFLAHPSDFCGSVRLKGTLCANMAFAVFSISRGNTKAVSFICSNGFAVQY